MARKKNKKERWHEGLRQETKQSVLAIFSFALALLLTLAAFGKAGFVGKNLQQLLELLFGRAFFLVPLVFFVAGLSFLFSLRRNFVVATGIGALLFLFSSLGIVNLLFENKSAGYVGLLASLPFAKLFDFWAALLLLSALLIAGVLIMTNLSFFPGREKSVQSPLGLEATRKPEVSAASPQVNLPSSKSEEKVSTSEIKEEEKPPLFSTKSLEEFITSPFKKSQRGGKVLLPPLELLESDRGTPSSGDIKANANIIKRAFQNFGIEVEMMEVNVGPSVTQYTLKPAEGVKLSRITALQNDLSLALAAHPLRIEAPIPGRSLVGIEIPNRSISLVGLRSLLSGDEFQKNPNPLPFVLGRDVTGSAVYADLSRMPHLLIAGATGTGKSIAIHSILMSLLYRNPPEFLRFIVIDPKRVELFNYSKIPHLLTPVITEPKKTILALRWAAKEMERRYEILSKNAARDIHSYHSSLSSKASDEIEDTLAMPYLVIVIDELADIMTTYPRELEGAIVRLAQMSRAVGIHLILSTQRPSVEVITGLIKANITSRIALQVASQVDSRTILDTSGAEKLLGNGDMLFLSGDSAKPRRIQGAFVSEKEIKKVTAWLSENIGMIGAGPGLEVELPSGSSTSLEEDEDVDDVFYEEAKRLALEAGKVSASYLQRRLKVGYARAARLLDIMEERGIIGPQDGAKPREVLIRNRETQNVKPATQKDVEDFYESFS